MAALDQMACQVVMDPQDQRAIVVKMVVQVLLVPLVILDPQGTLVQLERQVKEEVRVLLVLLALLVLLVLVELQVPKVLVVTKVKLASVAPMALRVIEDFLVSQVPLDLLVLWVHKVQMEVQEVWVQEVPLAHPVLPERMVRVVTQVR